MAIALEEQSKCYYMIIKSFLFSYGIDREFHTERQLNKSDKATGQVYILIYFKVIICCFLKGL